MTLHVTITDDDKDRSEPRNRDDLGEAIAEYLVSVGFQDITLVNSDEAEVLRVERSSFNTFAGEIMPTAWGMIQKFRPGFLSTPVIVTVEAEYPEES